MIHELTREILQLLNQDYNTIALKPRLDDLVRTWLEGKAQTLKDKALKSCKELRSPILLQLTIEEVKEILGLKNSECDYTVLPPFKPLAKCEHCNGDLEIRNPKGFCDHLEYPDYCNFCIDKASKKSVPPESDHSKFCPRKDKDAKTRSCAQAPAVKESWCEHCKLTPRGWIFKIVHEGGYRACDINDSDKFCRECGKPRPAENKRRLWELILETYKDENMHKLGVVKDLAKEEAEVAKAEFVRVIESIESHERSGFFGTFISKEALLRKASEL